MPTLNVARLSVRFHLCCSPSLASSERARQTEQMFRDIREDQVGRDRRHLIEPGLAEFAFDFVVDGEAETAMGLQADIGRLPGRVGSVRCV